MYSKCGALCTLKFRLTIQASDPLLPGPIYFFWHQESVPSLGCVVRESLDRYVSETHLLHMSRLIYTSLMKLSMLERAFYDVLPAMEGARWTSQRDNNLISTGRTHKVLASWCFGLFKRLFNRTKVGCIEDNVKVFDSSAVLNLLASPMAPSKFQHMTGLLFLMSL